MTDQAFTVQKPTVGASYRVHDPLGFPVGAVNDFLEHLEIRGRSAYTLHSYATGLADFLGWLQEADVSIDDVTRQVIGRYITDFGNGPRGGIVAAPKSGSKRRPRTVNHRLSVLGSYFAFRLRRDDEAGAGPWFQRANPISATTVGPRHGIRGRDAPVRRAASEFHRRVPRRIPTQIDAVTAVKLIDAARSWRDKSILTLLFRTGQRIGDWIDDTERHGILGMTLADTDARRKTITVRLKGARDEHRVPVTDDFWPLLHRYMEEERRGDNLTALWIGLRRGGGAPLRYSSFESSLRYAGRKIGVRVHAHMFRHLLAQTVLEVTGNLKVAQDLLGHAQISTTADLYMHADQAAMVNAVAAVKFALDKEAVAAAGKVIAEPLRYAFPYDATTIEELDKAAASNLLLPGESS
jgi:site-specific recombinase XerD